MRAPGVSEEFRLARPQFLDDAVRPRVESRDDESSKLEALFLEERLDGRRCGRSRGRNHARRRGYDLVTIEKVWEVLKAFASFGFCTRSFSSMRISMPSLGREATPATVTCGGSGSV